MPLVAGIVEAVRHEALRGDTVLDALWLEYHQRVPALRNVYGPAEPSADPQRKRVGVVPSLAYKRVVRAIDARLDEVTASGATAVVGQVLSGMGGVGKSQAAAAFAERLWRNDEVDVLVWVTATSRDQIVSAYAQAATEIGDIHDTDPDRAAERLLAWLATTDKRWLVVLDDVQSPADVRRLWPPTDEPARALCGHHPPP